MKKQIIQNFFLGLMIAFTISVIILSAIIVIITDDRMIPVTLIGQSFILSVLCSLINLVYCSEKLKFIWQSLLGYILTTSTIIICGLIFGWYGYGGNGFEKGSFVLVSFLIYSLCYLITWMIIWSITKAKKKELNDKLEEYKQRQ
ncbi:hypothetical protein OXPF_07240 [Oxobacter pfennigii]|uniref:DUF3021 domain-containing protein n=1 Tax=Oxobacter pfennigii TaxID=36849 RepID=A0A0P9AJ87_9CLOT|nr:DUF3021 family protein [Oxobacter pfennigii]KPU45491.1 hypothetical protein OXPF_07240 [Oxobacter pfennigii]